MRLRRNEAMNRVMRGLGGSEGLSSVRENFDRMDADNSGSLSYDEFNAGLEELGVTLTKDELKSVMTLLDENGDGELQFEEFESVVRAELEVLDVDDAVLQQVMDKFTQALGGREGLVDMRRIFDEMDEDGSGTIDRAEFKEALKRFGMRLEDGEFDCLMKLIDANNDGELQFEELEAIAKAELECLELNRIFALISITGDATDQSGAKQVALEAAQKGIRFARSNSVIGDLTKQGDAQMLSAFAMQKRQDMKSDELIVATIRGWWDSFRNLNIEPDKATEPEVSRWGVIKSSVVKRQPLASVVRQSVKVSKAKERQDRLAKMGVGVRKY